MLNLNLLASFSCNLRASSFGKLDAAVAGGIPYFSGVLEPVGEQGQPLAVPSNPNSRLGRLRSPILQGREKMDTTVVGIDVSKDRLDVHVRPGGALGGTATEADCP